MNGWVEVGPIGRQILPLRRMRLREMVSFRLKREYVLPATCCWSCGDAGVMVPHEGKLLCPPCIGLRLRKWE